MTPYERAERFMSQFVTGRPVPTIAHMTALITSQIHAAVDEAKQAWLKDNDMCWPELKTAKSEAYDDAAQIVSGLILTTQEYPDKPIFIEIVNAIKARKKEVCV